MIAYLDNDNLIRLTGARAVSLSTGVSSYLNAGATVTFRVQTDAHVDVLGETWPLAMTYVTGSDGEFLGVLRNELVLTEGESYRFIATIDNGVDQHGTWDIPLRILRRVAL